MILENLHESINQGVDSRGKFGKNCWNEKAIVNFDFFLPNYLVTYLHGEWLVMNNHWYWQEKLMHMGSKKKAKHSTASNLHVIVVSPPENFWDQHFVKKIDNNLYSNFKMLIITDIWFNFVLWFFIFWTSLRLLLKLWFCENVSNLFFLKKRRKIRYKKIPLCFNKMSID